jgi:hypothetical protein
LKEYACGQDWLKFIEKSNHAESAFRKMVAVKNKENFFHAGMI